MKRVLQFLFSLPVAYLLLLCGAAPSATAQITGAFCQAFPFAGGSGSAGYCQGFDSEATDDASSYAYIVSSCAGGVYNPVANSDSSATNFDEIGAYAYTYVSVGSNFVGSYAQAWSDYYGDSSDISAEADCSGDYDGLQEDGSVFTSATAYADS